MTMRSALRGPPRLRVPMRKQELEVRRVREFRPAAEAAVLGVVALLELLACLVERRARQLREVVGARRISAAERVDELCAALADLFALVRDSSRRSRRSTSRNAGMP